MAQEVEWPSSNQNATDLIAASSKEHVNVSQSRTLNELEGGRGASSDVSSYGVFVYS